MVSVMAKQMSDLVINEGFTNIDEVWGTEIGLIASGLYAGTTDCVGIHKGEEAIIDFKHPKKLKKKNGLKTIIYNVVLMQWHIMKCMTQILKKVLYLWSVEIINLKSLL